MAFVQQYFTADTHFGHKLMISPTIARPRPFADTREMDEVLVANWNAVVRPDDLVYHLGDFSFGLHDKARVRSIFERLQGRKVLILGNHDYGDRNGNAVAEAISELPWELVTQQLLVDVDDGQKVFCAHYAQRTWPGIRRGNWHFFGHSHGAMAPLGRSRDVGVDCADVGYAPRTFKQLTASMRNQQPMFEEGA